MITREQIQSQLDNCLLEAKFPQWEAQYKKGKVRDMYLLKDKRVLITTDRQSAFDHVLGAIPLKGQVLNRIAQYWFEQTEDIAPNQNISVPDANVTIARELEILPVEIVVRRYMTGSSDTAIWTHYNNGVRQYCGHTLPEGMIKNQPFDAAIITPTTKDEVHAELISRDEILAQDLVAKDTWEIIEDIAFKLFARGEELAAKQGLILVDTKYEMGLDPDGNVTLADEVHTPDSSRFWVLDSYADRHANGEEPVSLDKEFLRLWLRDKGISDTHIPELDDDIRIQVAERYIDLFQRVTGTEFEAEISDLPILERIEERIAECEQASSATCSNLKDCAAVAAYAQSGRPTAPEQLWKYLPEEIIDIYNNGGFILSDGSNIINYQEFIELYNMACGVYHINLNCYYLSVELIQENIDKCYNYWNVDNVGCPVCSFDSTQQVASISSTCGH